MSRVLLFPALLALFVLSSLANAAPELIGAELFPETQVKVTQTVEEFGRRAANEKNERRRRELAEQRGVALRASVGDTFRFEEWICVVREVRISSNSKIYLDLAVVMPIRDAATVVTMTNYEVADTLGTEIRFGDRLVDVLRTLAPGDVVIVSGSFIAHERDGLSGFLGPSIPTLEPRFDAPKFLVRYAGVRRQASQSR